MGLLVLTHQYSPSGSGRSSSWTQARSKTQILHQGSGSCFRLLHPNGVRKSNTGATFKW